jgi:DNA-binding NarL/FixJ family response regulator
MTPRHLFLVTKAGWAPSRWREAFPEGQALEAPALIGQLRGLAPEASIAWLSGADAEWPTRLREIREACPGVRVVLLSGAPESDEGLRALDAGVRGYSHAYAVPELLGEVATVVGHGGLWVGPELLQRLVASTQVALAQRVASRSAAPPTPAGPAPAPDNPWSRLTAREVEVARAVSAGRSNREVAELMFISERTVKAHLGVIFEKLGVRDRLQLVLRLGAAPESAPRSTGEDA